MAQQRFGGHLPEGHFTSVHTEHHRPVGFTDADARSIEELHPVVLSRDASCYIATERCGHPMIGTPHSLVSWSGSRTMPLSCSWMGGGRMMLSYTLWAAKSMHTAEPMSAALGSDWSLLIRC